MRIARIILGLLLIGYGLYSGNTWFYLGVIPLATGLINWCPMERMMGGCKDGECASGSCCTPKVNEEASSCCTPAKEVKKENITRFSTTPNAKESIPEGVTQILILGTGCAKCVALKNTVDEAVKRLEGEFEVKKVEDIEKIMSYGVVSTPGFVINGEVKATGKALSQKEIIAFIEEARNNG